MINMSVLKIDFRKISQDYIEVKLQTGNTITTEFLDRGKYEDFVKYLLTIATYEIDYNMYEMFIESIKDEVRRAGYELVSSDEMEEVELLRGELKEKDDYIAKLEAQISRDRESLIKEGERTEILKKYLANQREWIND